MVGAFPVFKLGVLAAKQISRPIANKLKQQAKNNSFFSRYVCRPPGQLYHMWDTRLKFRLLGLAKPENVKKLTDEAAAEVGAEILGEFFMFTIGTFLLLLEFRRQSNNELMKEAKLRDTLSSLQTSITGMEERVFEQAAKLEIISRHLEIEKK